MLVSVLLYLGHEERSFCWCLEITFGSWRYLTLAVELLTMMYYLISKCFLPRSYNVVRTQIHCSHFHLVQFLHKCSSTTQPAVNIKQENASQRGESQLMFSVECSTGSNQEESPILHKTTTHNRK